MTNKYRVRYSVGGVSHSYDLLATGVISALNAFHQRMQNYQELSTDRRIVLRGKLAPDEYKIDSVHLIYPSGNGGMIESGYDLPSSPNPDVRPKQGAKPPKAGDATYAMDFMSQDLGGRLAE